ncbi:hypothetical protein OJAV_G00095820 [Oryzias javanicus]|uniref:PLAT domain-containing protein n=1 Tax=Oryzias javanicus TaxID=123683 RepID=A0A437D1I2_ORYJA|nr:hypothetical protein OJAV_G00095820 [Oryzias javanicus]
MGLKGISLASSLFHRATMKGALLTWILYLLNAFLAVAVMGNMKAEYQVTVYTQNVAFAGTKNDVYITLVGKRGTSKHQKLERNNFFFHRGDESTFTVTCSADLGQLLQIHLEKRGLVQKDKWLPAKVEVRSPHGKLYTFPVYHWLTKNKKHFFREGTALLDFQETDRQMFRMRKKELEKRRNVYRWSVYHKGMPLCIQAVSLMSLPPDDRYPFTRDLEFAFTAGAAIAKLGLEALSKFTNKWRSMWDIEKLYKNHVTSTSDYVMKYWREDAFFGYQFLNGVNPMMIQRCETLPSKFPVPLDMILSKSRLTLRSEMKRGNIFLCDYNILDGVETRTINGRKQFLTAPLVLLHKNEYNQMMPIAIQLKQKPGKYNPIFFPTDSEYDWLLAKTYVRSAEFNLHELNFHLLRTHLLAEVYAIALQRNIPRVHPVYKLLIRHTRYTLQINLLARSNLISKIGVVTQFTSSGGKGMLTLMDRSVSCLTYRSLCIPDDIADRGLEDVPNFYYRDDGLKLWNIIHRFGLAAFLKLPIYENELEWSRDGF